MSSVLSAVTLFSLFVHLVLFLYVQARASRVRAGRGWLSMTLLVSATALASLLLNDAFTLGTLRLEHSFITVLALAALLVVYGSLIVRDITNRQPWAWLIGGVLWLVGIGATAALTTPLEVGQREWVFRTFTQPSPASLVTLGGFALLGMGLIITAFYGFYAAKLPEVANRALFWVLNSALVLMATALLISGSELLIVTGIVLMLIGMFGATYAQVSYRVFDIRNELGSALKTLLLLAVTTAVIYGALWMGGTMNNGAITPALLYLIIAIVAALVYVPIRQFTDFLTRSLARASTADPTEATRRYSHEVSKAVEVDQLVDIASRTLDQVMKVRRSGLVLVDTPPNGPSVELRAMQGGDLPPMIGALSRQSPIYQQLAIHQQPLTQFDIEFSPDYRSQPAAERQFLQNLKMTAYAPVIVDNTLIGILACGQKISDVPLYAHEIKLLATMADQTGVALRNARLVSDLRHLNEDMKNLNSGLEEAKEQVEKLDSVKTDFVTIASHELRTPLAQIRGYTDIVDALNDQGLLDRDKMAGMVLNLRKATERMEELIGAMLDVSQLDVNAMDLRFAPSSLESVMRMAIEPLTDAVKQRKLTLSARGLRGLPTVQADMQRLVQAFRNVIVNSIKFTPDGGRIDISGALQPAQKPGEREQILVSISDSGVGIDRENLELIFQKFFRAYDPSLHSTGAHKFMGAGPGLGLTIAKGVIEGHGGKIWAESAGHNMESFPGSTFYILLPVSPPEDARRVMPFEGAAGETTSVPNEASMIRPQG